jgi:hypothetical protein
MVSDEEVFREKLKKFLNVYQKDNGIKKDLSKIVNLIDRETLHDIGQIFLNTHDKKSLIGGKRKTRNKRKGRKRRKNRTRKVQRGGQFNRFSIPIIVAVVASFLLGRYWYPVGGQGAIPVFNDGSGMPVDPPMWI